MARMIHTTGRLTDEQITGIYAAAERAGVHVGLWQDTPAPDRSSFRWAVEGPVFRVRRFVGHLKTFG
jgi:hypothetical protein